MINKKEHLVRFYVLVIMLLALTERKKIFK